MQNKIRLALLLAGLFTVAACGGKKGGDESTEPTAPPVTAPTEDQTPPGFEIAQFLQCTDERILDTTGWPCHNNQVTFIIQPKGAFNLSGAESSLKIEERDKLQAQAAAFPIDSEERCEPSPLAATVYTLYLTPKGQQPVRVYYRDPVAKQICYRGIRQEAQALDRAVSQFLRRFVSSFDPTPPPIPVPPLPGPSPAPGWWPFEL